MGKPQEPLSTTWRLRFELKHALYAMALFGASIGVFGWLGVVLAAMWISLWWLEPLRSERTDRKRGLPIKPSPTGVEVLVVLAVGGIVVASTSPAGGGPGIDYRRYHNLMAVRNALESYHSHYGSFPPAFVANETGHPQHSWRVLILPQLGYGPLHEQYHFDETL